MEVTEHTCNKLEFCDTWQQKNSSMKKKIGKKKIILQIWKIKKMINQRLQLILTLGQLCHIHDLTHLYSRHK